MGVTKKVQEAGLILGALGTIGVIGIVFLMIYGNLSGNLGFPQASNTTINESLTTVNDTGIDFSTASLLQASCSNVIAVNESGSVANPSLVINSGNYTLTNCHITYNFWQNNSDGLNDTSWNVTFDTSFADTAERRSEAVIDNVSAGFGTFFGFSNTFFTIAAVVLLIFMLVGLLAIVMKIMQAGKGSDSISIPK